MSDKRTQDAAGLLICQHCGVVLKQRVKNCRDCGGVLSRYSPTVMPALVIKRVPAASPQRLRPENDPLLVERVIIRCRFNEAMTPKPRRFRGSRAFLLDQENADAASPLTATESMPMTAPALAAPTPQGAPGSADFFSQAGVRKSSEAQNHQTQDQAPISMLAADWGAPPETAPAVLAEKSLADGFSGDFFAAEKVELKSADASEATMDTGNPLFDGVESDIPERVAISREPAPATVGGVAERKVDKLVKNVPHPSFMVADMLLLVVQENDGQTLSLTHTIEGADFDPVFGLLPGMTDFNIGFVQETPATSVCLSANALSFHDANREGSSASHENEPALNIDSRLAFEEGLSRIAALRLQGSLAKSGVVGFENPNSNEDLRSKFTKKINKEPQESEAPSETVDQEMMPEVKEPRPKERSVFNPKRAPASELQADKIAPMPQVKSHAPKKNPLAMVAAGLAIMVVIGFVGFIGYTKLGSMASGESATAGGAQQLPAEWHMVLMQAEGGIYQDYSCQITQKGKELSGSGADQIGAFTITGQLTGADKISFQKEYESAGYIWPIMFSGSVDQNAQTGSFASGTFSWRKSDLERVQGEWLAGLPVSQQPQAVPVPQPGMPPAGMPQPTAPPSGMNPGMAPPGAMAIPQQVPQPTQQGFGMPGQR